MAEQVVRTITELDLKCSICMNRYCVPKMLDCTHTFCETCLDDYVKKLDGKDLTCPLCRKGFDLPAGVGGLQTNIHLVNLCEKIDLYEKLKPLKVTSKECDICQKNPIGTGFCVDCKYAICEKCEEYHSLFPALQSHSIQRIHTVEFEHGKFLGFQESAMIPCCDVHVPEKLRFYCKTCSKLICRECTVVQHPKPDHVYVEASSQFEELKGTLSKYLSACPEQLQIVSKYVTDAESGGSDIHMETQALLKDIHDRYEKVKLDIEDKFEKELEETYRFVKKKHTVKKSKIDKSVKFAANWMKRMESTKMTTQKIIQGNNMWEVLSLSNNLLGSFRALETDSSDLQWDVSEFKLEMLFTPSHIPSIQLGQCSSTYLPAVVSDLHGNFVKCSFTQKKSTIEITRLRYNQTAADPFSEVKRKIVSLPIEYPDGFCTLAATSIKSYLILGVYKWLVVYDLTSNLFRTIVTFRDKFPIATLAVFQGDLFIVFGTNPNTIYHAPDFQSQYNQYHLRRENQPYPYLGAVAQDYQKTLTPYVLSHNIKTITLNNIGVILLMTDNSEVVQYQLDTKAQYIVNMKTPASIKNAKKLAILNVCCSSNDDDDSGRYVLIKGNGYSQNVYLENFVCFILWVNQMEAKEASCRDKQLFITRYESSSGENSGTWYMSADVGLPCACYWDCSYKVLRVCNVSGRVFSFTE